MPISPLRLPAVILFRTSFRQWAKRKNSLCPRQSQWQHPHQCGDYLHDSRKTCNACRPHCERLYGCVHHRCNHVRTGVPSRVRNMAGQRRVQRLDAPETQYTVETRVKATTNSFASLTNSINTTTKTAAGDGPQVGGIIVTDTTITLPYDATWEYSTDGTTWNDTREFTGLTPTTQHTYYVRIKETTTAMASNPTEVKVYTAASAPAVGVGFATLTTPQKRLWRKPITRSAPTAAPGAPALLILHPGAHSMSASRP